MFADYVPFLTERPNALAIAGACLVVGSLVARLVLPARRLGRFVCQLISFAGFTSMLLVAGVTPTVPTPEAGPINSEIVVGVFKAVWWLAAAWLLAGLSRSVFVFKRQPRETQLAQDLVVGVIYGGAGLAIVADVFDMPISGLLAASGIVAIVVGLALQSTLGDVFSGIVLNFAKPFHSGDWVIVDRGIQGRVIETNWRATKILTPDNDLAIVPNSIIAKARLINVSQPMGAHGVTIVVRLEPTVSP